MILVGHLCWGKTSFLTSIGISCLLIGLTQLPHRDLDFLVSIALLHYTFGSSATRHGLSDPDPIHLKSARVSVERLVCIADLTKPPFQSDVDTSVETNHESCGDKSLPNVPEIERHLRACVLAKATRDSASAPSLFIIRHQDGLAPYSTLTSPSGARHKDALYYALVHIDWDRETRSSIRDAFCRYSVANSIRDQCRWLVRKAKRPYTLRKYWTGGAMKQDVQHFYHMHAREFDDNIAHLPFRKQIQKLTETQRA